MFETYLDTLELHVRVCARAPMTRLKTWLE